MNPYAQSSCALRDIVAVDVSKKSLQVHSALERFETANDRAGRRRVAKLAESLALPLVVCEPSGGYERPLLEDMAQAGVPCMLADASQARHFALSQGQKAKSDPIDSAMLYAFARQRGMQPRAARPATAVAVADLLDRRTQLSDQAAAEKSRLDKCPKAVRGSVRKHLAYLEREIDRVEKAIAAEIIKDSRAQAVFKALVEVKGVGKVTAWSVIGYMPEIGQINRRRLASLAGLAPFVRQSGDWKGQRHICGGRSKVRDPLYMAAASARVHNQLIREFFERLEAKGKPYKVCITAVMRKLLIHLQCVVKKVESELA